MANINEIFRTNQRWKDRLKRISLREKRSRKKCNAFGILFSLTLV